MKFVILLLALICSPLYAHEMTPAYPKLVPSYMDGIYRTEMTLFNKRMDVQFYQIQVYDKKWQTIPFAASSQLIELEYLGRQKFDVYIRKKDVNKISYICTESKLNKDNGNSTVISSRICSKIK